MKCFLHIGTEKTATKTIQSFFDKNREKLLSNGFIYTKSAGRFNNRGLSVAAYDSGRRDDYTKLHGIRSDHELGDYQEKVVNDLKQELNEVKKGNESLILSSEHFQSRLTHFNELEKLRDILVDLGASNVSVIVYLRRPAEIANSKYSTTIRSGGTMTEPPPPGNPNWNHICNHRKTIETFGSVFGELSIIPRLFDEQEFHNGSIIEDLLSVIGISDSDSYTMPQNANESLSPIGVDLLRRVNKLIPVFIDNKPNPVRSDLLGYIDKHFSGGTKYTMPGSLYEKYDMEFQDSNEWVRQKYYPHKESLFTRNIPRATILRALPDAELDSIAAFIADIWNRSENETLNRVE